MHKARAFFYVCAGLFLLALACHLGARSAGAQSPANSLLAMTDYHGNAAIALDQAGKVYYGYAANWTHVATTPSAPADVWYRNSSGVVFIALQNGDLFVLQPDWTLTFDSNVFAGPTPAQRESFGAMKSRYRGERGAVQPPQGR